MGKKDEKEEEEEELGLTTVVIKRS